MCPPMYVWLAETIGADKELINKAVIEAKTSSKYQVQCKILREYFPWELIRSNIIEKLSN